MSDEFSSEEESPDSPDTATAADPFYITGGTLPLDADSYIVRRADTQLLDGLMRGDFCYVLNTRQMGKSSLMVRAARQLREDGCRVALLDLTAVGQNLTVEQWYYGLLARTAAQTRTTAAMTAFWKANRDLGPMQRFVEAIRHVLLEPDNDVTATVAPTRVPPPPRGSADRASRVGSGDRLIIFVDEIDVVRSLPFSADEFFAGIRECYNRRPQDPVFERLTFCLLGVASPSDLVQDTRISPFNIGTRIELADFTPDEAVRLANGMMPNRGMDENALSVQVARRLLQRVLFWTGGHPYMTQRLCRAVAQNRHSLGAATLLSADPRVDRLCRELFLTKRAQETDDNLTFVRNRLLNSEADTSALLDLYRAVRRSRRGIENDAANPLCSLLQLSGAAAVSRDRLVCRNRIYERVFDNAWIDEHLPGAELRRQRAAFRRGVWRTALVGGSISLGFLALATFAVNRALVARRADNESRARLSRAYVEQGIRLMDAGDASGALAPLTEAMRLDAADSARVTMDRYRIGSALAVCPQLDHLWSTAKSLNRAAFSPDKTQIAAVGDDGLVYLWEVGSTAGRPAVLAAPSGSQPSPINDAVFSPDGTRLVTCHDDAHARIWDVRRRRLLYTLQQTEQTDGNRRVLTASWSGNGRRLVLVGGAHYEVWELPNAAAFPAAAMPRRIESDEDTPGEKIAAVAFAPDGSQFALTAHPSCLGMQIGVPNKKIKQAIESKRLGECFMASHVAYSHDGSKLLVAGGFLHVLPQQTGGIGACVLDARFTPKGIDIGKSIDRQRSPIMLTSGEPLYASFSPDEKRIATASTDGTVQVWDATTGKPLTPVMRHTSRITEVEFSLDGTRIVTASIDGTAHVWDAATGEEVCAPLHHAGAVVNAAFGRNRDQILTASRDGTVRLWHLPERLSSGRHTLFDPQKQVAGGLDFQEASSLAVQFQFAKFTRIYDFQSGEYTGLSNCHLPPFQYPWGRAGDRVLFLCGSKPDDFRAKNETPYSFQVWDIRTNKPLTPILTADAVRLSNKGGSLVLYQKKTSTLQVLAIEPGCRTRMMFHRTVPWLGGYPWTQSDFGNTLFSPEDRGILSCDAKNNLYLLDAGTGASLTPPMPMNATPRQWAFSPDGRYLFALGNNKGDGSGQAQIWNTADGTQASPSLFPISFLMGSGIWRDGDQETSDGLHFSADGRLAVTRSQSDVWLWRLNGDKRLAPQRIALPQTQWAFFSPDGKRMAAINQAHWLWSTEVSPAVPVPVSLEPGLKTRYAAFSPDSRRVIAVYEDGTATIYKAQTGLPLARTIRFPDAYNAVFSPDGAMVATGNREGKMRVWDAATGEPLSAILSLPEKRYVTFMHFLPEQRQVIAGHPSQGVGVWNFAPTTLPDAQIQALSVLFSGQQLDVQLGTVFARPEATRAAWKAMQETNSPSQH